jgi:laminin beta 1
LNCQDFTSGYNCDRCIENYYGDPLLGSEIGCRPCRCPDTVASGHSFATECALISSNNDVVCYCQPGYAGTKCDICDNNYFGNPEKPGGECNSCNCTGNVDLNRPGNCDAKTGKCLQCLYDTAGDSCEFCRDGYYGTAEIQDCRGNLKYSFNMNKFK